METYNKKYKIVAPDGYVEEWSQADFEKGGAALMSDNPDVKVYSQESYDPTQQYGTNVAYGIEDEDGYFESWTADEWSKGKDALLKDHPNLKIYVLGDASQDYHRQKAEEQRQAITDFDAVNKDFIRAHELDSLIMSEGGAVGADYDANDKKYNDLLAEREQLVSNYAANPTNKQDWRASAQYADQIASNYESKLKGMRDATRFSNAATSMYSGNIRENNDYVLYEQARKLAKDAAKAYAAPSYGEHTGFGGYVKDMGTGAGKVFSDVDFWSRGLSAIDRDKNVRKIVNSLSEKGINVWDASEKELYDNLSPAQLALISSFLLDAQAQYERSLDTARGYNAGVTFAESIGYMAEFLATGGIARAVGSAGKAASSGFGKLLANELSKGSEAAIKSKVSRGLINTFTNGGTKSLSKGAKAATNMASKAAGKAYSYGIRPVESTIWHTALQPSTYRTISENLTQINDNGDLVKAGSAIWGGVLDQLIENWSESMGGAVEDILGLPLKGIGAAGEKILGKTTLGQWGKWLADSASAKVLHEAGFNGLIGEMGEEWLGNAARVGLGLMTKDEFKDFASFESQVDMAASFAPMTLFGLGTSSYAAAKQDKNYRKLAKDMRGVLNRAGWSEEDVAEVMDVKHTKEEIARTLAPVLQSIVRNSQDGKVAQEDYITTLKFAQAAAIQEVLSSAQTIEQERARKDMQEEIAQDLGAVPQEFKNEDGTTVIYPADNRGNFSYTQVEQTPSGNYGVKVVTTAKDAKGEYFVIPDDDSDTMLLKNRNDANAEPRFISRQEFQEQVDAGLITTETSTLDNYLDARIEEKREMQRKDAENAQLEDKYQQVAQKMQVGSKINAGTEEAPMEGVVLAVDRGGVTVDFGQPVLLNGRNMQIHKLSLEQAGNFVGIDARIESEQRSVEEQVEQDEINSAKVKAYNQSLAGEQFTVDGHLYTYAHMFEMPQLDDDGTEIAHIVATDEQGRDVEMDIPLEDIKTRETDAAVKNNEQVEEVKDDNVLRDIHGNPIPMRVNEKTQQEEVDKRTFKNKDPEAYYAWNDAQRGGNTEDSMQAITADIASETAQLTALQKQLTVETDPDMRDELHESVNKTQNRINLLEGIYHKYDAENNFQDEQLDFARRIYDVQSKLINAKTQEQVDALIKIKADLFRQYQLATVDSAENVMLAKRAVELQQEINSVADVPVQVVFESNIEAVMRTDGASEASINRVLSKVAELRSARITSGKDLVMTGLYNEGKVYIFAEGNADASSALLTYYHERQHMRTAEDPEAMNKVLVLARNERDNLIQVLSLLTDNIAPYQGANNQELADEIVASAMEKACTDEKYEQTLRSRGLSEELINIIKTEYAKQRRITDSDAVRQEDWNANVRTSDTGNGQQDGAVEQGASGNGQLGTAQLSTDTGISEEEPQIDTTPRDFRGNPLPLEADGTTVDQKTLWENDPEAWARWNDDINNDAGADSIAYINAVIEKLNKAIKTNEKAYAKATDFDKRDTLKGQIKEEKQRLDELQAILRAYRQKQSEEASAKMQADAVRAREARKAKAEELAKYNTESLQDVKRKWEDAPKDTGDVDSIVLANGERIEGHYVLTEAFAPTPSHDPVAGYSMTKGFPVDENGNTVNDRDYQHDKEAQRLVEQKASSFDQRALQTPVVVSSDGVVLSGNDRTMASQIAARQGTDNNYNTYLASHPQRFGFTADQISNYSNPRVVFVPDSPMPYTAATFAKFNAEEKKTQSKTESAVKAGKTISPEAVEHIAMIVNEHESIAETYSDKNAVAAILRILIDSGVVQESEISRLMDGDSLSGTGEDLVESVILGAVMREDALRCAMGDKMIRRSVMSALTQLLKNNTYGEYSLSGEFSDAVVLLYQAKRSGLVEPGESVANFMNQPVLDGFGENPLAEVTVQMLANTINGAKVNGLKNVLSLYNARAEMAASGQADLFLGAVEAKEQIIREILNEYGYNTETFTTAAAEQRPEQQSGQQSGQGNSEEQTPNAVSGDAGSGAEGIKPVGNGPFGAIYDKFRGKAKDAIEFLRKIKSGEAVGALHHKDIGEISIVWGNRNAGLEKILRKHPEVAGNLQSIIDGMQIVSESDNRIKLESPTHFAVISKEYLGTPRDKWLLTAYEKKNSASDNTMDTVGTAERGKRNDTATPQNTVSDGKSTQSSETKQENAGIFEVRSIEEQRKVVDTDPTEAQKKAGNYRMGHVRIDGLDITIENPRGSIRKGTDADGHEWQTEMHNDYGYIRGTKAVDDDHIDVFLSDNPTQGKVYVIDQVNPKTGEFDESKVMYGFDSEQDAREAYLSNYEDGWQGLGKITEVSKEEFKKWIDSSTRKTKPFSEYASVKAAEAKKENTTDNQGNPVNEDGTLKVEKIESVDDLTDEDFSSPTRSVQLPKLPDNVDAAIGANGKPIIIKKNIFERNSTTHHEVSPQQAREILTAALYRPDLYGQNQKATRPYNWIVINTKDNEGQNKLVVLEVNDNKDNVEIVHWYVVDNRGVEKVKRQAAREGGHILILPSEMEEAGALSGRPSDLSSDGKFTQSSETKQVFKGESGAPRIKKVNLFDFVDKDKHTQRPIFKGVYHDKGMLVATDTAVLVAIKDNYPEELERAVTFKDGHVTADVKFPDWRSVFTNTGKQTKVDITLDKLASYLERIKANVPKKILTDEDRRASFVVIDFGDGNSSAYNYERLVKFVNAARFLNAQVSYCSIAGKSRNLPDKKLVAEGANGMVALFPVNFSRESDYNFNYNVPLNEAEDSRFRIVESTDEEILSDSNQKDSEYFAAIERGDMEEAQRIVNEFAQKAGYTTISDYQGTSAFNGAAPYGNPYFLTKEERKEAWDNDEFDGDQTLGDYIERGIDAMNLDLIALDPRNYRAANSMRKEAIDNVRNAIQKRSKTITMFRSVPSEIKEGSFRNGDWVTPSRAYAVDNAKIHGWGDNYNIIKQTVSVDEIWWDGNDIAEWGYGREEDYVNDTDFAYKNTKNNRKLLDVITRDDDGNIIPPSKRFDSGKADERYRISGRKAIDKSSEESRIAYEAVKEQLDRIGIPVELLSDQAMREMAINANALETVSSQDEYQQTVVSSASGAKVINNLDNLAKSLENESKTKEKTFLGALAKALDAKKHGSNSQYATFEAKNGTVVTIRLANHNVTTSTFDNHGENDGISIVVSARKNNGIINDGKAHVTEFYYDAIKLRKAEGKPLVDIVKSVKQSLYSGEYKDTTGLAQREEVNAKDVPEFMTVYHGSGAKFDKFDHSHMGEGEGAQAYGWGTYVTEVEGIGRAYAKAMAAKDDGALSKRNLYTVEIPEDINSTLSKDEILKGLDSLGKELFSGYGLNDVQINAVFRTTREWYELGYTATSGFFPLKEVFKAYGIDAETIDKRIHDEAMEDRQKNPAGYGQYLSWEKPLGEDGSNRFEGVISGVFEPLSKGVLKLKRGRDIYNLLSRQYGSAQAASKKLEDLGYIGISYPAQYMSGGRPDGARNYVIFNENNAKIVDRIEFLREPDGTVYGATVGGKIYLNRERLNPNTPIHEYTHLWFSALKDANLELYKRGVELMKQLPIWEEVRTDPNYANLSGDDAIASECLSRLVGDKGADVLTKMAKDANVSGDILGTAHRISLIEEFKDWLKKFWTWVRDSFAPWTKEEAARVSVDDIQNMVLSDLAKGVNPLANAREESEMKKTNDKYNDDNFEYLIKRNPGSFDAPENGIRFRIVTEPKLIEQLNLEPTVKVFRAMQIVDGELFPPMSITVNGKKREPSKIGQWEQSEENPELADEDGYFKLNKGKNDNGKNKSLKAKYNPYFHTSLFPLNDQFSEAQTRSNIVIVEGRVPKSELTSGYRAEKAKDSVGKITWHSGPIAGILGQYEGKEREVILSRWFKPERIVPYDQIADLSVQMFKGTSLEKNPLPSNVFHPDLRNELEKRGVSFVETNNRGQLLDDAEGRTWSSLYGKEAAGKKARIEAKEQDVVDMFYDEEMEVANEIFNKELQQQIDGKLPSDHIYRMGQPGRILLSTGVPDLPIQMNASRLKTKATSYGHDFELSEIKDLVKALQTPLAVFAYGDKSKAQNIIVPLQKDGKNFIVGLSLNPTVGGRSLEINSIRNVFPKNNYEWLNWISQGKTLYLNKAKVQTLINQQRTILADVEYLDLNSVANIVKSFENPSGNEKNIKAAGKKVVKTLAGVHNITEEKLRKALKLGGFANPSLAVIDTEKSNHENFGEISLIAPSALVNKESGRTAGTWTTDAYTQRYPSVERQMSDKGYEEFSKWVDGLDFTDSEKAEIKRQTTDALEDNREPAWGLMYLKEKGIDIKAYSSDVSYGWEPVAETYGSVDDVLKAMEGDAELDEKIRNLVKVEIASPLLSTIRNTIRLQIYEETGKVPSSLNLAVTKRVHEIFDKEYAPKLFDENGQVKSEDVRKVVGEMLTKYNDTKRFNFQKAKARASTYVHNNGMYTDYLRWQEEKLEDYGTKGRIFRGYNSDGTRRYSPETLENVSKAMSENAEGETNGSEYTSFGSFIAKLAPHVDNTEEMRSRKDKLSSADDEKKEFYDKWKDTYYALAKELYDDVYYGEKRLHEIVLQQDPKRYAKKEYGITLSASFMKNLEALKKAIREDLKSPYFETKFERPVGLNEFAAAVVPDDLGADVRKMLDESGIALYEYDPAKEGDRSRAFNEALEGNDKIRFRIVGGNSGYVGYSMSKRAAEAKEEGRFPKTQFVKEYGVPVAHLDALVAAGIISNDEWHHTSKFGNKTPFYGWVEDSFLQAYNDNKAAIEEIIEQYNGTNSLSFTERRELAEKIAAIIESSESVVSSREPAEALIAQREAEKAHRRDVMSEMANSEGKIKKSGNEYWYNADNQVSLHMHENGRIIDIEFPIGTKTQSQRDELYKAAQEEFREAYERAEKILQDKANENSEEQKLSPDVESSGSHFRAVESYDGLQSFGQDKLFDIMHKTFADLPESTRAKITKLAPTHGYKFHEATADYFASLATKKDLSEEEKMDVMVVRDNIKAALDIDYLSFSETLWALYNTVNKNSKGFLSIARRTLAADELGFMPEDRSKRDDVKDGVRFSIKKNSHGASAAEIYNKATSYWYNRLRESYVDMNESVNDLVAAIESTTKQPAQAFEDVRLAINRQSSKGLNQMTKFMSDYLEPMWGAVGKVMEATGMTYDEVVRYVMLKHAVERNDVFARRDARRFYERKYDSIISKLKDEKKQKENMRKRAMANAEISIAYALDQEIQNIDKQIDSALKSLDSQLVKVDNGTSTKYKELREQDYGGLTSMYSKYPGLGARSDYATDEEYNKAARKARVPMYDNVSDMENAARSEVNAFEKRTSGDEFNELWRRINAATKKTLESQYDNNIISKEQYKAARDQFKYYVPLRGFKDTEAEDIWTYMDVSLSGSFAPALKNAKGRKSEAENPFNWIGTMASSAIAQNVKNEAKLALYYFIANRPNQDLVTIGKVWYQYDAAATAAHAAANPGDTKKIFTPVYPPVTTGLDSNAAKDAYDTWEADMKAKAAAGEAYQRTNKLNVQDDVAFISDKQMPQHVIKLKVRGEEVNLYINGDPRAAQAINGMLNVETNSGYQKVFGPILRWMSAVNTSYNPEFWISNLQRDFLFALMSSSITGEGANNLLKGFVNPKKIMQMMRDYEAGKLGNSREENYYREFAEGGGITGFTVIVGNEVWEKKIQEYLSPSDFAKISKSIKFDKFLKFFNDLGEAVEQMSRFAAFISARETGKSIEEAVAASKEITVNFNRKGSGKIVDWADLDKLTTADGAKLNKAQKLAVFTASFIPAYGRRFVMFFNAAVQGTNAMYKLWKKDHRKTLAWASGYFAIGVLQAVLHALADDDDDYLDIPDYTRRSNLLLGGGGIYFKWALPQEMRPFYAWGDIFVNQVMGREPNKNMLLEMANSAADILPLGPGGVLPSVIQPSWDLYTNKDFTGSRIYNDNKYLSDAEREARPNYKDPRPQTNKLFIDISQVLNALSGGDEYSAGAVNVHPESMQHVVESLGGGLLTTMNKTEETVAGALGAIIGEDMIDQDLSVRRFPFLNRVLMVNDERTRNSHVSDLYYYYKDMSDVVEDKMRRMKKEMNYDALEKLQNSPEYEVYQIVKSYKKMMQRYDDDLKAEEDRNERKNIMREQDELRKEMINEISQTR